MTEASSAPLRLAEQRTLLPAVGSTTNTYTLYDEAGHWLGDYDNNGAPKQQAIWQDDLPVVLLANANKLHYIEPDHLGSPRVVIDPTPDVAVWTWSLKGEAFGTPRRIRIRMAMGLRCCWICGFRGSASMRRVG